MTSDKQTTSSANADLSALARLLGSQRNNPVERQQFSLETLDYHGIAALVYENLNQLKSSAESFDKTSLSEASLSETPVNKELENSLKLRQPLMVANEALRLNELTELFDGFAHAGLQEWLVFKGTALAYSSYPKPWLRPRTDTDILISEAQLDSFSSVFEALGYQREFAITGDLIAYQCTFGKRLVGDASINIDVHWRINNRQCLANAFTLPELLQGAQRIAALGQQVFAPSKVDSLLIACLHRLGHHHTEERLAWLYDIHLLSAQLEDSDWLMLENNAKAKKLATLCADGLNKTQKYFDSKIPSSALESLSKVSISEEPSSIFLNPDLSNWQILMSDLKAIRPWSSKLRFVIQTAIPSPDYIRKKMHTRSATLGYLKRSINGLKRLFGL